MKTETLYSRDISYLETQVEEFLLDRIVFDVQYVQTSAGWAAHIIYADIF